MPSGWPGNVVKILLVRVRVLVTLTVALSTLNHYLAPLHRKKGSKLLVLFRYPTTAVFLQEYDKSAETLVCRIGIDAMSNFSTSRLYHFTMLPLFC